jgi:hypothetical protein
MPASRRKSLYTLHPAFEYVSAGIANIEARTGRTIAEWDELIRSEGPSTRKERIAWLKAEHGLGTNQASWLAQSAEGRLESAEDYNPEALVDAMFAGPKTGLRPLYEKLLALGLGLGKDVRACPCSTIVPLYRAHVFAQLKPSTRTRIDLGLALGHTEPTGRLVETGGLAKDDRITHRIPIASPEEIDDEVTGWLKAAYDRDPD